MMLQRMGIKHRAKKKSDDKILGDYRSIRTPDGRTIGEHRYVMEQYIGRRLKSKEHVHHRNGNGLDNRIENLELMSHSQHARLHMLNRRRSSRLPPETVINIHRDLNGGIPMRDIEKKYGRSRFNIRYQMARMNLHARSIHPHNKSKEYAIAVESYFRGEKPAKIIARTGLSHGNLYRYLESDPRYRPGVWVVSDVTRGKILKLRQSGLSCAAISIATGLHKTTVHRHLKIASPKT